MIDFSIIWSVVFAIALVRIVDGAVDYIQYRLTRKKRNRLFEELLAEIKLEEPAKKTVKKAAPKRKTR